MILSRYIIREHIGPFTFGLSLIAFIFTMNLMFQMLKRIAGKGLPVTVILEYFTLNLAWILALAVPMAVLISTLSAFGRMAGDGEITALRASGVSPWQMIRPALWGGLLMTMLVFLFNNYVLPDMNHRAKLPLTDISRKKHTLNIEPGVYTFTIPKLVLLAEDVDRTN
ncbi:MAG: LptF/LptG family permease, partial [Candidatus Electryoneaceae bacterium]|nr:LptF/LptG family permease [Candidatus Electryoneaceae bacterium]